MHDAESGFHADVRILDTTAIVEVNQLIRAVLTSQAADVAELRRRFLQRLRAIIDSLSSCVKTVCTSTIVYDEQIDPRNPGSILAAAAKAQQLDIATGDHDFERIVGVSLVAEFLGP